MTSDGQPVLFDLQRREGALPPLQFSSLPRALWTKHKAELISEYLFYFVMITKHGVYIDGFAGPQNTAQPESWAAKLVLERQPQWIRHFFFCDISPDKTSNLKLLRDKQRYVKGRTVDIACADFNSYVDTVLASDKINEKTAAFCLLDQRTFECDWATVQKIASRKTVGNKIEIFYFVPTGWFGRAVDALGSPEETMIRWWGKNDWKHLRGMNNANIAETFKQRFLCELGYTYAYKWPIYDGHESQRVMYYMIHASDHREAPKLMRRAYKTVTNRDKPHEQLTLLMDPK